MICSSPWIHFTKNTTDKSSPYENDAEPSISSVWAPTLVPTVIHFVSTWIQSVVIPQQNGWMERLLNWPNHVFAAILNTIAASQWFFHTINKTAIVTKFAFSIPQAPCYDYKKGYLRPTKGSWTHRTRGSGSQSDCYRPDWVWIQLEKWKWVQAKADQIQTQPIALGVKSYQLYTSIYVSHLVVQFPNSAWHFRPESLW